MKRMVISACILQLLCCFIVMAAFPVHSNTATCDMDTLSGAWDSFAWTWGSYDTQSNTIHVTATGVGYDISGTSLKFTMNRLSESGGLVNVYSTTNLTISTSNITWEVAYTNIPEANSYFAELWGWVGAATNQSRTIAQGKIKVIYTKR